MYMCIMYMYTWTPLTYRAENGDSCVAGNEVRFPTTHSIGPPEVGLYVVWLYGSTAQCTTHTARLCRQVTLTGEIGEGGREGRVGGTWERGKERVRQR